MHFNLNRLVFVVVGFLIVASLYSQKVKISSTNKAALLKKNDETTGYTVLDKITDKGKYIIAIKSGHMPEAVEVDELFRKNLTEFVFDLKPSVKPILGESLKKIKFSKFADPGGKIGQRTKYVPGGYTLIDAINLSDPKFNKEINLRFSKYGFNVITDESSVFNEKGKTPNLLIAAEVMEYYTDTRDTPGFRSSLVLTWSVFDIFEEKVVFKILTGGYTNEETKMEEGDAFLLAAEDAMQHFVNHPDFIKLVTAGNSIHSTVKYDKMALPFVPAVEFNGNQNYIESSIKSVVTIKSRSGHGSGFVISSSGYILSNSHVVEDSTGLEAILANGIALPLELIRQNKKIDVALLKIPGSGYTPLPLDTFSVVGKIGSDVVAIGTPSDISLGQTVTKGIISGLRDIDGERYIQIDASINGGNSGGPLINKKGQVIGINSLKRKDTEGIAFAIPMQVALNTLSIELKN